MKIFLNLCLLSGLLCGQELQFSFYGNTSQTFPVPFDTTFRHFPVPMELLEIGTNQQLEMIFSACEEMTFCIDNIRFPSNGYIEFEVEDYEMSVSEGVLSTQRIQHPSDSGYVLQINFEQSHAGEDTIWIEVPDSSYPVIPESVGLSIRSNISVDLWNYKPLLDMMPVWSATRYRSSDPGWDYSTLIETIYKSITSSDSIVHSTNRWKYPDVSNPQIRLGERTYTYRYAEPSKMSINHILIDFAQGVGEHSGNDSTWGAYLMGESYANVLDTPTFVKCFTLDGIPGTNLYLGYGMGIIREDHPGTNVHDDLVGVRSYDEVQGDFEQDVTLSIGVDQGFPYLTTFPPDSNWYYYKIPLSKLYHPEYSLPSSLDSLHFVLMPEILIDDHTGLIQIGNIRLNHETLGVLYDFSQQELSEWQLIYALNGSGMTIESISGIPSDGIASGFELMFYNDWQGSTHFGGFAEFDAHFQQTLQVYPDTYLDFWMRQSPTVTGIDDDIPGLPEQLGVTSAFPNPFNGAVTFNFTTPELSLSVSIIIHDIQGRRVWSSEINSGTVSSQFSWNGKDQHGNSVASGLYFASMNVDGRQVGQYRKLILIK